MGVLSRWKGKVAVVTGASSGIGAEIAEKFVTAGLKVIGIARREDRVKALAKKLSCKKGKLYAVKADLSKEEDIIKAFQWITKNVGPVSILVNNAGLSLDTTLSDGETEKWRQVISTNVIGLCIATREAAKIMKDSKIDGHIVHINSLAGHQVVNFPRMNVYPASKFAVTALTETLRQELNQIGSKIKVTSVSPGAVRTEFVDNSADPAAAEAAKDIPWLQPSDIADAVIYAVSTPAHVQIHEITIRPVGDKF